MSKYPYEKPWKRESIERKFKTYILNQLEDGKREARTPTSKNAVIIAIVPIAAAS